MIIHQFDKKDIVRWIKFNSTIVVYKHEYSLRISDNIEFPNHDIYQTVPFPRYIHH